MRTVTRVSRVRHELIDVCWRVVGARRPITCGLYARGRAGHMELRVGCTGTRSALSQTVPDVAATHWLAGRWRRAVVGHGSWEVNA